jgi:hypothetical protein
MTAKSVVPPPMSTTKLPPGLVTGSPAPMAAIIACSAWRAPQHFFGLSAHRLHFPSAVVKSNG